MNDGLAFVNEHQELMISLEKADPNTVVKFEATTRGGNTASKTL